MEQSPPSTLSVPIGNEPEHLELRDTSAESVSHATVHLVIEKRQRFYFNTIRISSLDPSTVVIEKVQAKREEFVRQIKPFKMLLGLFWGNTIDIATICTFPSDLESQSAFYEVIVRTREPSSELTSGYKRPALLDPTKPFARLYPDVVANTVSPKVLLVGRKLKKRAVLWFSFASLLVAVIIGVLVGILAHNVDVGVQTTGGITGAIAVLVSLSIWILHEG